MYSPLISVSIYASNGPSNSMRLYNASLEYFSLVESSNISNGRYLYLFIYSVRLGILINGREVVGYSMSVIDSLNPDPITSVYWSRKYLSLANL